MSELPIEPLPAEIAALLEREKDAYPEHAAMKPVVYARVETALVLAGLGPPAGGPGGTGGTGPIGGAGAGAGAAAAKAAVAGKFVAVGLSAFLAGGVVGGVAVQRATHASTPKPTLLVVTPAPSAPLARPHLRPSHRQRLLFPRGRVLPRARVRLPPRAPSAISRASASSSTSRARRWGEGGPRTRSRRGGSTRKSGREDTWLRSGRSFSLQALVAAGRRPEAAQHAAQFRRTFPGSMLMPAVDAAMSGALPDPMK